MAVAARRVLDLFFTQKLRDEDLVVMVQTFCTAATASSCVCADRVSLLNAIQCIAHRAGPGADPAVLDLMKTLAGMRAASDSCFGLEEDLSYLLLLETFMAKSPALRSDAATAQAVTRIVRSREYRFEVVCFALAPLIMIADAAAKAASPRPCIDRLDLDSLSAHPEWKGSRGLTVVVPASPLFNDTWRLSQVLSLETALKRLRAFRTKASK